MPLLGYGESLIFTRGDKLFELTNHLGNVLSTISDKRYGVSTDDSTVVYFNPDNGKEQDPEVKGTGNQYDYGFRIYDPRVGKFFVS